MAAQGAGAGLVVRKPRWSRDGVFWTGLLLLAGAASTSATLVAHHLEGVPLPGCGLRSACARALTGPWSRVPGLGWPIAEVGLAHFCALFAAWLGTRGRLAGATSWIARAGALVSVVLSGVLFARAMPCPWCLSTHGLQLAFWGLAESRGRLAPAGRAARGTIAYAIAFAGILGGLRLVANVPATPAGSLAVAPTEAFRGRYLRGPADARVRIVAFSDFRCEDCRRIAGEIEEILASRDDTSFSPKHFPLSSECNPEARRLGVDPHPGACEAARAAEAAGDLLGDEGFFRLHHWLFARGGLFTRAELTEALPGLGFEPGPFLERMQAPEIEARIRADIEEGLELGLHTTPMIFLNGREFRDWSSAGALARAVAREAEAAREGRRGERPPSAVEKLVEDWRRQVPRRLPPPGRGSAVPLPADGVEVVVWGDYFEPFTRELDRRLRDFAATHPRVRYSYRHFPADRACNPAVQRTLHPGACLAARLAEAAASLGGPPALDSVHSWLMGLTAPPSFEDAVAEASRFGLDRQALAAALASPSVASAVRTDIENARRLGLRSIPFLFIDGRWVPRWRVEGVRVPEAILERALSEEGR